MNAVWKALLASVPAPLRRPLDPATRNALLKFAIVIAISLFAGGELVTAMEMRILLEILGVALFTTAFLAGGQLLLLSVEMHLRGLWLRSVPATRVAAYWHYWLTAVTLCVVLLVSLWTLIR